MASDDRPIERCAYCDKERPRSEMHQVTVRHYHTQRHLDKPR